MFERTTGMEELSGLPESNKRADSRFPVPPMVVSFHKEQDRFFGVGLNLSRSGMFFQTPELMNVGDVFQIKFTMPKTDMSVTCKSKVVWRECFNSVRRRTTHAGIQFIDIDPGVAERLCMLVQKQGENKTH